MSNNVLALMCKEMIEELHDCMETLQGDTDDLKKEWKDKIISAYAIICN